MTGKGRFCFSDCTDCLTENPPTTAKSVKTKVGGADTVSSKHGPDRDDDVEMVLVVITPPGGEVAEDGEGSVTISQSVETAGHKNYHSRFILPYRPIF